MKSMRLKHHSLAIALVLAGAVVLGTLDHIAGSSAVALFSSPITKLLAGEKDAVTERRHQADSKDAPPRDTDMKLTPPRGPQALVKDPNQQNPTLEKPKTLPDVARAKALDPVRYAGRLACGSLDSSNLRPIAAARADTTRETQRDASPPRERPNPPPKTEPAQPKSLHALPSSPDPLSSVAQPAGPKNTIATKPSKTPDLEPESKPAGIQQPGAEFKPAIPFGLRNASATPAPGNALHHIPNGQPVPRIRVHNVEEALDPLLRSGLAVIVVELLDGRSFSLRCPSDAGSPWENGEFLFLTEDLVASLSNLSIPLREPRSDLPQPGNAVVHSLDRVEQRLRAAADGRVARIHLYLAAAFARHVNQQVRAAIARAAETLGLSGEHDLTEFGAVGAFRVPSRPRATVSYQVHEVSHEGKKVPVDGNAE